MKNKHYRSFLSMAFILLVLALAVSCSAAPDIPDPESFKSYVKPSQPKNLVATHGAPVDSGVTGIKITWDNAGDADYYRLYIANAADGNFSSPLQLPSNSTSYIDNAADGLVKLYYLESVKSFSLNNGVTTLISEPSETVVGSSTPAIEFYVRSGVRTNTVNWVVRGADYDSVSLFDSMVSEIYRNGELINTVDMAGANGLSYKDNVSPDTSYIYQVRLLYGNDEEEKRSVTSSEISVVTGYDYSPEAATNIFASDGSYYIENGVLKADKIDLEWRTRVHNSILSDPDAPLEEVSTDVINAHPYFLIERRVKGTSQWETALSYADNDSAVSSGDLTRDVAEGDTYYNFNFYFKDFGVQSGTEYEYRITTRYYFSENWYTDQESESSVASDTGSTLAFPSDFTLTPDSSVVETDEGKDITAILTWTYGTLPSGFNFVIERRNVLDASSTWTAISPEPRQDGSSWTLTDEFSLSTEELTASKNYSYRISLQTGNVTSPTYFYVPAPLLVNGMSNVFNVVDVDSFKATTDLAAGVQLSWTTDLKAGAEAGYDTLDLSYIKYTLQTNSDSDVISGYASDDCFSVVQNADNTISVSYMDTSFKEGTSYMLTARYVTADGTVLSETTTSQLPGGIISPVTGLTAALGQASSIPISFTGDAAADSFNLYYRYKGTSDWLLADTIKNTEAAVESYNFTVDSNKPLSEKGNRIEFAVTNIDKTGGESAINADNIVEGSYFGLATFSVTASESVENNIPNIDKITLTWTMPDGAVDVVVYRSETLNGTYTTVGDSFVINSGRVSGVDTFTADDKLVGTYYYKVVPYSDDITPDVNDIQAVRGTFFAPPVNIEASKGTQYNGVRITWDAVDKASGYILYRRPSGSSADWTMVDNTISADETSTIDRGLTAAIEYEYTLATKFDNANASMLQNSQVNRDGRNVGYPLVDVNPETVVITYDGNGNMTLSFGAVKGATKYEFIQAGILSQTLDATDSDTVTATFPVYGNSNFLLGESFTLKASNDLAETEDLDVLDRYTGSIQVLSFADIINFINSALAVDITAANSQFGGDWFPPSSASLRAHVNEYSNSGIYIKSAKGGSIYYTKQSDEPGYISLTDYSVNNTGIILDTEQNICIHANDSADGSGYLGIDPLQTVGHYFNDSNSYGKIAITINEKVTDLEKFSLRYRDVRVDQTGGSYEILLGDDVIKTIEDSEDFPRLLN